MAWGRKRRTRLDGLVVEVVPPWNTGSRRDEVTLVVRSPGGVPVAVRAKVRITKDRWLVRGMTVPVVLDPAHPQDAEIDEDAIPSLAARLAAGDPALVDPITAVRAAREATEDAADAAMAAEDPAVAASARDMRRQMRAVEQAERDERMRAIEEQYLSGPATAADGRLRGYGRLVARSHPRPHGDGGSNPWFTDAIFSVRLIGREAYAVLKRYDREDRREGDERYDWEGAGIVPVLVDRADPQDVELLWDEVPRAAESLFTAAKDEMDRAQRAAAPLVEGMYERLFAAIPDATTRATLAAQVRAQGWAMPEHLADGGAGPPDTAARLAKLAALRDSGVLTQAEYDEQVARMGGA